MRIKFLLFLLVFFSLSTQIFARGKAEETTIAAQNNEWVLCITEFDVSSVPQDKLTVASVITRKIVERMNTISYRTRISPEYAYYEDHAWTRALSTAARSLSAKQDERSLLLYRGDPTWRYKQNLARVDADIERLRTAFEEIEQNAPLINNEPEFKLTAGNLTSSFPAAPREGGENRFCQDQRADAFLAGSIMDFHGRFFVTMKLYTIYTRSYVWEDSIIFSPDDLESALDEMTGRLNMVLSGNRPAAIVVNAQPEETLVLINRAFAGRGSTGIIEHPPGTFVITASAPDHESLMVEAELSAGELAEIDIRLKPLEYGNVEVSGVLSGGSVYHGALYVGEAPLTLRLPLNLLEYVELETLDDKKGRIVFETPSVADTTYSVAVRTAIPEPKGRVDSARRIYYWAWGGTWITGIAAWLSYQTYLSADEAIRYDYAQTGTFSDKFANTYELMYYASIGTVIAVSAAVLYEIFHIGRYVYIANKGSTSIAKTGRK